MRLPAFVDERFLQHRLRSTSHAGIICAALALVLFLYRYIRHGVLDVELFVLGVTFVVLKYALLLWYRRTD